MDLATEIGPIEKGIPVAPKRQLTAIGKAIRAMQPGDSRLFKTEALKDCARMAARYAGIKITVRKSSEGGWRIWRKE